MSDASRSSRTVTALSDGARWAILAGIPFLALAAYFFFTPISLGQPGGGYFYCGSPSSANVDAENVCGPIEDANRNKALASLAAGLALPLAGLGLFGVTRRSQDESFDDAVFVEERREGAALLDDEPVARTGGRRGSVRARTRREDSDLDDFDDDLDGHDMARRSRRGGGSRDDWADEDR